VSNLEGRGAAGPPWWALLPAAQAGVPCGEQSHRLLWSEGKLIAPDHPDAEGERVLAALGGERSECVDMVEAWGRHGDDLEVLAIGPRSAADELTIGPRDLAGLRAPGGWVAYAPRGAARLRPRPAWPWAGLTRGAAGFRSPVATARMRAAMRPGGPGLRSVVYSSGMSAVRATAGPAGARRLRQGMMHEQAERARAGRTELLSLLALGPEFQWRLAATVAAAWAGGSRAGDPGAGRPALVAALTGRLAPAARAWLNIDPGRVDVSLHEDAGWGRLALSGDGPGRRLSAALPVSWLASVWAAGLAVIAGHLVVAVTEAAWPDATVLGVPEPGADPVILKVRAMEGTGRWVVAGP
jgi:hypothetical protein